MRSDSSAAGVSSSQSTERVYPLPWLVLIAAAAAIWPTWSPLAATWHDMAGYSYGGYLVLFVFGWALLRTTDLPPPKTTPSPLAASVLLGAIGAWLIAYKAASAIGEQILAPIILWSSVWMACGLPIAERIAPPVFCLYFAIPVWELLLPWLQQTTVLVTETLLGWAGVPVHIEGVFVKIPEGTFEIVDGCAGKREFVAALAVGTLCAGSYELRPRHVLALMFIAAALALITNWLRVFTIIYAGHVSNMTSYLVAREHLSFGWLLFALLVTAVSLMGARFAAEDQLTRRAKIEQNSHSYSACEPILRPALPATVLLLCVPVLGVVYVREVMPTLATRNSGTVPRLDLPAAQGIWSGPYAGDASWQPRFEGATAAARAAYDGPTGRVEVFLAQYEDARPGAKLISSANALIAADWMVVRQGPLSDSVGEDAEALWVRSPQGQKWLVSYLYRIGNVVTSSPILAQLAYGVLSWAGPVRSQIAAVAGRCPGTCESEAVSQIDYWNALGLPLLNILNAGVASARACSKMLKIARCVDL